MVFADVKQRRGLLGSVVCALVLWVPFSVQAATYYVSPQGNDAWSGTSQSQPWRTIGRVNQPAASRGWSPFAPEYRWSSRHWKIATDRPALANQKGLAPAAGSRARWRFGRS